MGHYECKAMDNDGNINLEQENILNYTQTPTACLWTSSFLECCGKLSCKKIFGLFFKVSYKTLKFKTMHQIFILFQLL